MGIARPLKLAVIVLLATIPPIRAEPLKVMTYNVWLGFNRGENLDSAAAWLALQDSDVFTSSQDVLPPVGFSLPEDSI